MSQNNADVKKSEKYFEIRILVNIIGSYIIYYSNKYYVITGYHKRNLLKDYLVHDIT